MILFRKKNISYLPESLSRMRQEIRCVRIGFLSRTRQKIRRDQTERKFSGELPTKCCISIFYFPVNEAPIPDLPGSLLLRVGSFFCLFYYYLLGINLIVIIYFHQVYSLWRIGNINIGVSLNCSFDI